MKVSQTKQIVENAKKASEYIAELCKESDGQINNQTTLSTGMLAVALLASFFKEDHERMGRLLLVLMRAADEILDKDEAPDYLQ